MDKRLPIAVATLALALASCADVRMAGTDDDVYYEFGLYDSSETLPAAMADTPEIILVQAP